MALLWTEDLAVGFGLIDTQHQELFNRYNGLLEACKAGKGRATLAPLLDFLVVYVTAHFAEEERFMQRFAYPERVEHERQHREMIAHVADVRRELDENGASIVAITTITQTLFNWLLKHVKQTDVKLGRFLTEQNAS